MGKRVYFWATNNQETKLKFYKFRGMTLFKSNQEYKRGISKQKKYLFLSLTHPTGPSDWEIKNSVL